MKNLYLLIYQFNELKKLYDFFESLLILARVILAEGYEDEYSYGL